MFFLRCNKCIHFIKHYAFDGYAFRDVNCGYCLKYRTKKQMKGCSQYVERLINEYGEIVVIDQMIKSYDCNSIYLKEISQKIEKLFKN